MKIPNPIKTLVIDKLVREPDFIEDEVSFEDMDFVNMIIEKQCKWLEVYASNCSFHEHIINTIASYFAIKN